MINSSSANDVDDDSGGDGVDSYSPRVSKASLWYVQKQIKAENANEVMQHEENCKTKNENN